METGLQVCIDKTKKILTDFNLMPKEEDSKLVGLLNEVLEVDEPRVLAVAEVVKYSGKVSEFVREKTQEMHTGTRYEKIAREFDAIRKDVNSCIGFWADGKIDLVERVKMVGMFLGGNISTRFKRMENTFKEICNDVEEQLKLEEKIFDMYSEYRVASMTGEELARKVYEKQTENLEAAKKNLEGITTQIADYKGDKSKSEYTNLLTQAEVARQAQVREDSKYQLLKDTTESMSINNKVGDALMVKIEQSHKLKNQVYRKGVTFFETCQVMFATLNFGYTQIKGQNEMNKNLDAMERVAAEGMKDIADISKTVDQASIKTGYGQSNKILDSYKQLLGAIENYESESKKMIEEERQRATYINEEMSKAEQESRVRRLYAITNYGKAKETLAALPESK